MKSTALSTWWLKQAKPWGVKVRMNDHASVPVTNPNAVKGHKELLSGVSLWT